MKSGSYFFQCSGGLILLVGHPDIIEEPFLELMPGDKVTQVGLTRPKENPGQATLNRTDEFRPYITFRGTRVEPDMGDQNFLLMFEVRQEDKPVAINSEDNFYIAYIVLFHEDNIIELKTYDHRIQNFRIYKPEFVKFKDLENELKLKK